MILDVRLKCCVAKSEERTNLVCTANTAQYRALVGNVGANHFTHYGWTSGCALYFDFCCSRVLRGIFFSQSVD